MTDYSAILLQQLELCGITSFVREYRFHPVRKWRWDVSSPELMIACEVQGATYVSGKHTRGAGYANDCEKLAEAQLLGWTVFWFPSDWIASGKALAYVEKAVANSNYRKFCGTI